MLYKTIKKLLNNNIQTKNYLLEMRYKELNNDVRKNMELFSQIDSIADVAALENMIKININDNNEGIYAIRSHTGESLHYGHAKNLYEYSNSSFKTSYICPQIEHGITFDGAVSSRSLANGFVGISQGDYMRSALRKLNSGIPLFNIGPFIHYATDYYDIEKLMKIRKENGRTMLVFPFHTHEKSDNTDFNTSDFFNDIINIFEESFDTIYVCAYWLDLDTKLINDFRDYGANIVSAGARFDPEFLSRLKTIMLLSDEIYSNDLGTNIGYGMYLNKPIFLLHTDFRDHIYRDKSSEFLKNRKEFSDAFSMGKLRNIDYQKKLYKKFWGGEDALKTADELKYILEIHASILKKSKYNIYSASRIFNNKQCNNNTLLTRALE